jgi:hypothetical protein
VEAGEAFRGRVCPPGRVGPASELSYLTLVVTVCHCSLLVRTSKVVTYRPANCGHSQHNPLGVFG